MTTMTKRNEYLDELSQYITFETNGDRMEPSRFIRRAVIFFRCGEPVFSYNKIRK